MFTGIINGAGQVRSVQQKGQETRLFIQALFSLENIEIGESIAVNGVCLTVESGKDSSFNAYASTETMQHTNLGALKQGSIVNLERALALGQRLGGHIVSGHVDGQARVASITNVGESRCVRLSFEQNFAPEVIKKGSITLDGISLTINNCGADFLEVNIIPETWASTTVKHWQVGSLVNLETDIIGKYVRHLLAPWQAESAKSKVSLQLLAENGFI